MIEANEDITLVVERQLRNVQEAKAQYQAVTEGREVHPAILQQQAAVTNATTLEVPDHEKPMPSALPAASVETAVPLALKFSVLAIVVLAILLIKLRMHRQND